MTAPRLVSLCTGYGGLDLAIENVTGARLVATADIDTDASSVIARRFPDVPNLGDIARVDWQALGPVDVLSAGYPCQPFSIAGKRKGTDDERHIWPHINNAVRVLRPRVVVLENVAGHLTSGFGDVIGDLAEAGMDARWCCVRASDVGAPHRRERVFVVARPSDADAARSQRAEPAGRHDMLAGRGRRAVADADRERRESGSERHIGPEGGIETSFRYDADRLGDDRNWGRYGPAICRWGMIIGRPAPEPMRPGTKQLSAEFVEWMMGLPAGWVTDLLPNRHALRILGNGVVPQQAAHALRLLVAVR